MSVLDETGEDLIASGSGTIYSTTAEAVYIITNQHVIASGGPIHVSFANGEQLPAGVSRSGSLYRLAAD